MFVVQYDSISIFWHGILFSLQVRKPYYQWIASLYFFQSMPFVVVSLIATMMYQQQGVNNTQSALITSLLALPWAIKPLFAPFLERFLTKKRLTILSQTMIALLFFALACSVNREHFLIISVLGLTCLAFTSSIHDIVSDGLYMINLDESNQKRYVALRSFFYQMGRLVIKGGLLVAVGYYAFYWHVNAWKIFFYSLSLISLVLAIYHLIKIPEVERGSPRVKKEYFSILHSLLTERSIYSVLFFIFIYPFSEAQMQKIVPLFLLDSVGLDLSLPRVGELYGILGGLALMLGIFTTGFLMTRYKIEHCLSKLTLLLLFSHLLFLIVAYWEIHSLLVWGVIALSQFVFGLVNGAYMGYLLSVANQSRYPMSMYTLCTAIMALSYVLFGSLSGLLEQQFGYCGFFFYIFVANCGLVIITFKTLRDHAGFKAI